ncbi:MAG: hypothetical protein WBE13_12120 [Candidatus Acidiferrum sp.]
MSELAIGRIKVVLERDEGTVQEAVPFRGRMDLGGAEVPTDLVCCSTWECLLE